MNVIFEGSHDSKEAIEHLVSVIRLFKEQYKVGHFREMHLSLTLLDAQGEEVELVDSETSEVYRTFEVYRNGEALKANKQFRGLKLVVDNTR